MKRLFAFAVLSLLPAVSVLANDENIMPSSTTVSYGDWTQNCMLVQIQQEGEAQPGAPQRVCEVRQVLNIQQQGGELQHLMTVAVGKLPGSVNDRLVIQTPANVALRSGVTLQLSEREVQPGKGGAVGGAAPEDAEQILLTYSSCNQVCTADKELTPDQLELMKSAQAATVTFAMSSGQKLGVPLSLKGFKAAISAAAPLN